MNSLTKEEKLNLILDLVNKHDITAYEIGKKTDLNVSSLQKLLKKEVKNPQNSTLNTVLEYIENRIVGKDLNKKVDVLTEPEPIYKTLSKDETIKILLRNIELLEEKISIQTQEIKILRSQLND